MYNKEFKQREMKFKPRIKLNHNICVPSEKLKSELGKKNKVVYEKI